MIFNKKVVKAKNKVFIQTFQTYPVKVFFSKSKIDEKS